MPHVIHTSCGRVLFTCSNGDLNPRADSNTTAIYDFVTIVKRRILSDAALKKINSDQISSEFWVSMAFTNKSNPRLNMQIDLRTDAYEIAHQELKNMGYYLDQQLNETKNLSKILPIYFNVIARLPPQINWQVKKSSYLGRSIRKLSNSDLKKGLTKKLIKIGIAQLIDEAKSGQDLKHRLSRSINKLLKQDSLLNDWVIFHFHLGSAKANGKSITNYDQVLYAYFRNDVMYLIMVGTHQDFANQKLIEIIEQDWSELLDLYTPKGIKVLVHGKDKQRNNIETLTNKHIKRYRNNGINTFIKTSKGRFIAPSGEGVTAAGTNINSVRQNKHVRRNLWEIEADLKQKPARIKQLLGIKNDSEWQNCNFKLTSFYPYITVEEINLGVVVHSSY